MPVSHPGGPGKKGHKTVVVVVMFDYLTKPLGMQASIFGACPKPG